MKWHALARAAERCTAPSTPTLQPALQVWKDALSSKQQAPYMTHTLLGGTLRGLRFCPYEVRRAPACGLWHVFVGQSTGAC